MNNIDLLKKKIIFRSEHRGIKEMDLVLGKFVSKHISEFNLIELKQLDDLLSTSDDNLFKWYSRKKCEIAIPENRVTNLLRKFKIK
tara:strand:- start:304 stop:561 length:258 start_codon:yes stop_codon:yes gene_type:complete